tara:strand:+ start:114 stop:587 length:474 start_codon:yes stop_codon:yes gene_type:complete
MKKWLKVVLIVLGIIIVTFPIWIFGVAYLSWEIHSAQYDVDRGMIGNTYELTSQTSFTCDINEGPLLVNPGTQVTMMRVGLVSDPGFLEFKPSKAYYWYTVSNREESDHDRFCKILYERGEDHGACYNGEALCTGPEICESKSSSDCILNSVFREIE